jgi:hypothetical protein
VQHRRFTASSVTWSLPVRILLTLPLLVPVFLIINGIRAMASLTPNISAILGAAIGAYACFLVPSYLRSVWAANPRWLHQSRQAARLESDLQESLDKNPSQPEHPESP